MKLTLVGTLLVLLALEGSDAFCSTKSAFTRTSTQCDATLEGRKTVGDLKPTNDFILVKKARVQEQTDSGILLAGSAKIVKTEGTVVSTGPGKTHPESGSVIPIPVVEGDGVVYGKYDGVEVTYNGEKHALIRDDNIMVKFDGELTLDTADVVGDKVLVHVQTGDEETDGGLVIGKSSGSAAQQTTGTVVKVGPGKISSSGNLLPMDVEVGDTVKFRDFSGTELEIGTEEYRVVEMVHILAKF
mmetsp:Transcript_18299/g.25794  ORF Transcript_18299/g.25794 Transcript_18299/m.25794 type:complete len:243 (-) Transcript_18299:140-868(-)